MSESASAKWRQEGNKIYKSVTESLAPLLQKSRLEEAVKAYTKALNLAANDDEKASAAKNVAVGSEKLANTLEVLGERSVLVRHYFKEGMQHYHKAMQHGLHKSEEWRQGIRQMSSNCWRQLKDKLDELEVDEVIKGLHENVALILEEGTRREVFLQIVEIYFNAGIEAMSKGDFKSSLQHLHNALLPVREAHSLGDDQDKLEVKQLEEDIHVQISVAESIQALVKGDELLKVVISEESLNIDVIWVIIDWYKQAIILTKGKDVVIEAVACSRLGKLYDQVLKLKTRAKTYLNHCLELATTLVPRNITGEEWYIAATTILARYQEETVRAQEEKNQKEQQETKEKIKHLLDPLEEKFKLCSGTTTSIKLHCIAFVKYVYEKHPPMNPDHKLDMEDEANISDQDLKKIFQKAVIHYHPDKIKEEEHGKEWKVLTEEICKRLTSVYEGYKLS